MATAGHNGFDVESAKRFTDEVMRVYQELEDLKIENMNKARVIRERFPDLYDAAKNAGVPLKPFKAHIKAIRAEQAYQRAIEKAKPEDSEDQEAWEMLRELATPGDIFAHAVKKHDAATDDADIRPRFLREKDAGSDQVASNVTRLEKGIKPLSGLPGADAQEA